MQHTGNIVRLVVVVALAFVVYQVVLTPAQRTVVTETVQQAATNSSAMPGKTVIQVVSTAAPVPTVVIRPIVQQQPAQVASEPLQEVAPTAISNSTVGNDPPGCIVTTDYRDGHQFCNDGRGFSDDDPRKQPGYCNAVPVGGGWWECEGGQYMAAIVNLPAAEPSPTPDTVALESDYIVTNGCVLAISRTDNQARTICPPEGATWNSDEWSYTAQRIIEGKFDYISPNGRGSGARG